MGGTDSPVLSFTVDTSSSSSRGGDGKQQCLLCSTSSREELLSSARMENKRCSSPSTVSTTSTAYSTCSEVSPVLPRKASLIRRNTSPIRYVPKSKAMVNLDIKLSRHSSCVGQTRPPVPAVRGPERDVSYSPVRAYMECLSPQSLKCVLVGDSGVGKTSMLTNYTTETFVKRHTPTIYDKFTTSLSVNGRKISMTLCDTSGSDDFGHLRPLCYPQADVALICFSVVNSVSLENAKSKWAREIKRHCPSVPIILVGTHTDKRDSGTLLRDFRTAAKRYISKSEGQRVAAHMKATYVECSSRNHLDVKGVFDEAIATILELGLGHKKSSSQCAAGCTIL